MAMTDVSNRRRHRRVPTSIRVFTRKGAFSEAVHDISVGGLQIETRTPLPAGTTTNLALTLPHHDAPLEVQGRVVWSRIGAMGIAFTAAVPILTSYVERLERGATQL
jgi:Tfp pilus assembly protein PilZ